MKNLLFAIFTILFSKVSQAQFSISVNPNRIVGILNIEFFNKSILITDFSNLGHFSKDGGKSFIRNEFSVNTQILNDSTFFTHGVYSLLVSTDNGLTSNEKAYLNKQGDTIAKIVASGCNYIFSNGRGFITSYSNLKPRIFLTENWGNTWEEQDSNKYNFSNRSTNSSSSKVKCKFEKSLYTIRSGIDRIIYQYYNYGDSIVENNISSKGVNSPVIDMAFKDVNNGIVLTTDKSLYITNDGCQSFTKLTNIKDSINGFIEYAKATKTKAGFYILALKEGGTIYSKDDGKTWYKNLDDNVLFSMDFSDAETGIVTIGRNADVSTNIFYFTDLVNGIKEQNYLAPISVSPNPATNTLNLNISEAISYTITNLQGQAMQHETMKNASNSIDISNLPVGVYIINVTTETGNYYSKFIKTE
ncbi:MAG: T9SS type A sorting domain-containing protein [Candidatus Methylacidiphilales bacterium]